ncbi:sodium:proline symporter [Nitrosomonas supralitoralis]|uniref:Sodium:proline symporter n=1 Tax=Nitrosomonas supralitoralis TaxID=2116706 RepID=A0A2P7NU48_9PROT|nr:sodium:proline symporter [Nitrosomonas supralitoralis]PSJ16958.1 sodium:proline symporter [Nitrosomonas supralitoralis]
MLTQLPKFWLDAFYAGLAASIFSTIAQILLWWSFWDVLPWILYRDAHFAAAIVLGQEVLSTPATLDWQIMFIATGVHFGLSIIYAIVLSSLIRHLDIKNSLIVGSLYGLALFIINMYGFVIIFPWFVATRDWITIAAHVVFGVSAAGMYKALSKR